MAQEINFDEASIYVGTYAKYNDGSIFGRWLKLADYSSIGEFYQACAELHADEDDPEYMFQDYEHIPETLISESWLSDKFFDIRDELDHLDGDEKMPFAIWCDNGHHDLAREDCAELIALFRDEYVGEYRNDEDFAIELIEERDDLSDFARSYFDYQAYARDIFCGDYWSVDGYVFRNS
ncbi:antirestriction protein ArdA [Sphingobacterium siyangense]|uniref:antirestriction protein ArdA n=1 Tax=Sphingobacterium siyangense TaxID=459529 RepID=UPI001963A4CA|nr:antirestriction protein ArdA [Sphingobacterium siyangense]QRY55530.1 antirestriction protein ArdA [Sphingobacterium siyangense]